MRAPSERVPATIRPERRATETVVPMALVIPESLAAHCRRTPERAAWLERLPSTVRELERRWSLIVHEPFAEASASWTAPVTLEDGSSAVLKLAMPHMEAKHELHGLRFWNGAPTVRLLEGDETLNALLLERCRPGTALREAPEAEQDRVIAEVLRLVWRVPEEPHPFRPLGHMLSRWSDEALERRPSWSDPGLVEEGLRLYRDLPRSAAEHVLLATDLHAGNVLRAERRPWLVIDPKPFIGDPAYDATQHLLNRPARLRADPDGTIRRFADRLQVDPQRVRLWTFARAAVGPWDERARDDRAALARSLAP